MQATNDTISWSDFEKIDIRVGTIIEASLFPEAKKPAYKLVVDLGPLGHKKSSAQITNLYQPCDLIGKQVICVVNFPTKKIGPFVSEILVTGFPNEEGHIILSSTERQAPNGARLF